MHPTRRSIYRFICEFNNTHGTPPSYREIARAVRCSVQNVRYHVRALIASGHLTFNVHYQATPALHTPAQMADKNRNGKARRAAILHFAKAWQARFGVFPTYAQIAEMVGLKSADTVRHHLWVLEQAGWVRKISHTRWAFVQLQSDADTKSSE